jgi:excisionase family DNA binding protein
MYSVQEYADLAGISRQAVLKKINTGKLKAKKVGRAFVVFDEPPKPKE